MITSVKGFHSACHVHDKHLINSDIKVIWKKMMRSFTLELLEVRLWENPEVNQTCSMTDIPDQYRTGTLGSLDLPLPLLQFHLTAAPAQQPYFHL